jgi:hypothetical protein
MGVVSTLKTWSTNGRKLSRLQLQCKLAMSRMESQTVQAHKKIPSKITFDGESELIKSKTVPGLS